MNMFWFLQVVLLLCGVLGTWGRNVGTTEPDRLFSKQKENKWFEDGEELIKKNLKEKQINSKARGVILFLGDGMGVSTVTTARILDGQLKNMTGEENVLSWESFPNVALSKTYNTDHQVPDSAGTATAFLTGVKTFSGGIGVSDDVTRGECSANVRNNKLLSILQLAELAGLSTGVVTTTRITHATPAASYAHSTDRNFESDAHIPQGCGDSAKDIALQLIEFPYGNGIDVVLGGGRKHFLPKGGEKGTRKDKRNLINEWKDKSKTSKEKFEYVDTRQGLQDLASQNADHLLGLFSSDHMNYSYNRRNGTTEEPSLVEMTEAAIKILERNKNGYFLLVEGGRIDHAHHENKAYHALHDTVELSQAVQKAKDMTNDQETLIVVTADHSHVFTMQGYQPRGNDIFGFSSYKDMKNKRYTTLGYQNGPGAVVLGPGEYGERVEPSEKEVHQPEYMWQSLVPLTIETHGGEDVGLYARGPRAHLIRGVVEQNYIFHVMDYALCLSKGKKVICDEDKP